MLPFALPYQNPENAFRVISDFCYIETEQECTHAPTFGKRWKVAKAKTEVPMLVLNESNQSISRFTREISLTYKVYAGKYVKTNMKMVKLQIVLLM
jgi:isoleucyl-tRNA synthetase